MIYLASVSVSCKNGFCSENLQLRWMHWSMPLSSGWMWFAAWQMRLQGATLDKGSGPDADWFQSRLSAGYVHIRMWRSHTLVCPCLHWGDWDVFFSTCIADMVDQAEEVPYFEGGRIGPFPPCFNIKVKRLGPCQGKGPEQKWTLYLFSQSLRFYDAELNCPQVTRSHWKLHDVFPQSLVLRSYKAMIFLSPSQGSFHLEIPSAIILKHGEHQCRQCIASNWEHYGSLFLLNVFDVWPAIFQSKILIFRIGSDRADVTHVITVTHSLEQ